MIKLTPELMAAIYGVEDALAAESYNVAPTDAVPVIVQDGNRREARLRRFGFVPFYAKQAKEGVRSINVRIETIGEKPAFKNALQDHRCVIPATGFYEWADGKVKQPYYFSPPSAPLLSFAGIWSRKRFADADYLSFAILTGPPHPTVASVHNRSPVMLGEDVIDRWLDNRPVGDTFLQEAIVQSHTAALSAWSVDRRVGNVRHNDSTLTEHAPIEARRD